MNHTFELIPLTIEIVGSVKANNLEEIMPMIREGLAAINRQPATDEEFGQAEQDVKKLKAVEDALKGAKDKALADAASIQILFAAIDDASEELRVARLELEKIIASEKERRKGELVEEALGLFDIDPLDARRHFLTPLKEAMKGKRTLDSMKTALRIYAVTRQAVITKSREIIDRIEKAHGEDLTLDRRSLELLNPDAVEAELRRRFEDRKARQEKARLEAEVAAQKAEADKANAALAEQAKAASGEPAPLPEPPKIGGIPTGPNAAPPGETIVVPPAAAALPDSPFKDPVADEWKGFTTAVFASFAPLKSAREALRYPDNQERAAAFAQACKTAWQAVNVKEVQP